MSLAIHLICMICLVAPPPRPAPMHDVTVTTVRPDAESVVAGRLMELSIERGVKVELQDNGEIREVPFEEVVSIRLRGEESSTRAQSDRVEIQLAGGDRFLGRPVGGQNDRVEVDSRMLGRVKLPLERIDRWSRGAVPARPADGSGDEPPAQEDVIALSNGDVLRGMVLAIDEEGFSLEVEGGEVRVPHARIASADLVAEPGVLPTGVFVRLRLIDGSQVTSSELTYGPEGFALRPFGGERLTCTPERIARIDVAGGKWTWLSALPPISVQDTPMITLNRPHVLDANVLGRPMRIADQSFERGLGVHTESSLLFELAGQYSEFVTRLGVDDAGGPLSDVTAEIRVDGRTAFKRTNVRHGELIGPVRIDVRGAGRIELVAQFGENAGIQDVFDWADAGLVR